MNYLFQMLNLHQLGPEDEYELILLGTGEYIRGRANTVLTGARCYELTEARTAGRTGSQTNYNNLASELPQVTIRIVGSS